MKTSNRRARFGNDCHWTEY